jgi:hypothetical protein
MPGKLVSLITSPDPALRNQSLDAFCQAASLPELLEQCGELESFRRTSENLYERVRALMFLYAIHRFHLPRKPGIGVRNLISFTGYTHLLERRFEEAIATFLKAQAQEGPSDPISSALAVSYYRLGIQTLANQVRSSVRSVRGNQWMFRMGHPADHPLRIRPELLVRGQDGTYPLLRERTPVRMDLTHCGWSDIFFLGMDYPQGAKVLNVSIDLGVRGRDPAVRPPVETYLRVIDEPLLRLTSVDLGATADLTSLAEVFDFAKDYLGLLKAAVIASGVVPPGAEGSGESLADLLARVAGEGHGLELVSSVNGIPKGSRLAVSTNLLASMIALCMRATGQAASLEGPLREDERRLVLARAILGEWLGGSGGGWQDSGGVWPGIKLIEGVVAAEGDPEFGISRGRLMPDHRILDDRDAPPEACRRLQDSLVLVHGGMAQNVGPILEMVSEKYLLRSEAEWEARKSTLAILDEILSALKQGDVASLGRSTTRNFFGPIQTIIPWATNLFTETLIERIQSDFGERFHGFCMLGGMSGGGMGFLFDPAHRADGQAHLAELMLQTKRELEHALPFAMEPVVYNFGINEKGTWADLLQGPSGLLPQGYYALVMPQLLRKEAQSLSPLRRAELDKFGAACRANPELRGMVQTLFERLFPRLKSDHAGEESLPSLLDHYGFDSTQHEQIRSDLKAGRIGLAQNRLPVNTQIRDVADGDVFDATRGLPRQYWDIGLEALAAGEVAVVTLAAGAGSRWTQGAGTVKALHPFCKLDGRHRTFLEVHLAKSRRIGTLCANPLPHVLTTSYLSHQPTEAFLRRQNNYGYRGPLLLSEGRSVGLRLVPMERDLRFMWEETPQQMLDEQAQKVRDSLRHALLAWALQTGEGTDYTDNVPLQCLHPVGHWFEIPNLLRNGTLARLLEERPRLKHLMLHNIDTVGADVDPATFGLHLLLGGALSFEVITRRIEDRGGGLARVNNRTRIVEGLAMPHEEDEFALSYYNSMTCWIDIDKLLAAFQLTRADLANATRITEAVRGLAAKLPTYVTLKEVKKRWGHGQEDIFPVAQFEKLWSDMTALTDLDSRFIAVPRARGQQLKDQSQLDGWLRDGSAAYVAGLCEWK